MHVSAAFGRDFKAFGTVLVLKGRGTLFQSMSKNVSRELGKAQRNMNENGARDAVDCVAHSRITRARRPLDSDEEEIADGLRGFRNWNRSEI